MFSSPTVSAKLSLSAPEGGEGGPMVETDVVRRTARSRYWREEDARLVVDAWRESGDSLASFCRSHGVASVRLSRWASRLGRGTPVRFHPVRLTAGGESAARAGFEIELRDGTTVRLAAGFALDDLRRILSALVPAPRC